jgi:hypothetical protein
MRSESSFPDALELGTERMIQHHHVNGLNGKVPPNIVDGLVGQPVMFGIHEDDVDDPIVSVVGDADDAKEGDVVE